MRDRDWHLIAKLWLTTRTPASKGHPISGAAQKAVLFTITAYEGQFMSHATVAYGACIDRSSASIALLALEKQGLIQRQTVKGRREKQIWINWNAVRELI